LAAFAKIVLPDTTILFLLLYITAVCSRNYTSKQQLCANDDITGGADNAGADLRGGTYRSDNAWKPSEKNTERYLV